MPYRYLNVVLDLDLGRIPAGRAALARIDALVDRLQAPPEVVLRQRYLHLRLAHLEGRYRDVIQAFQGLEGMEKQEDLFGHAGQLTAAAHLALGAPDRAAAVLEGLPDGDVRAYRVQRETLWGRIRLAQARAHLEAVVAELPAEPTEGQIAYTGEALLLAGGEDLDPARLSVRRARLARAAELLPESRRGRAIALRDRILEGPGAALEQIVGLIEAMGDSRTLLQGLARVVASALGANRVLVMLRIPGLGRQVSAREISGQEVAGLAPEILRHLKTPDDVWEAEDAFADPALRALSATVRTFRVRSVVAVAIPRSDEVIGALYVDDTQRSQRFSQQDVTVLQRIARAIGQVAGALPTVTPTDGLTVHDVHGVYTSEARLAQTMHDELERFAAADQANLLVTGPTRRGQDLVSPGASPKTSSDWRAPSRSSCAPGSRACSSASSRAPDEATSPVPLRRSVAIQQAWRERKLLFLDEVQNLGEVGQRVLLPLLELPVRRFGGLTGNARPLERPLYIVVGTNADVDGGAWRRHFREDLWFRMRRTRVDLPPLHRRGREAIYRHLGDAHAQAGLPAPEEVFAYDALQRLATHAWPGNLRSLGDFVDRAGWLFRKRAHSLTAEDIDRIGIGNTIDDDEPGPVPAGGWEGVQARALLGVLEAHGWVQAEAARELQLSKYALHRRLKKLGLLEHVREQRNLVRQAGG